MVKIRPMRAVKVNFDKIIYPVIGSPKLDGIRCLMQNGVAMSKSMKPIPNKFVQSQLSHLHGLDGELMTDGDYNSVQSAIMSVNGAPDFFFNVFDYYDDQGFMGIFPYRDRIGALEWYTKIDGKRVRLVEHQWLYNKREVDIYLNYCLDQGREGVMLRNPEGIYKLGTSTTKEGYLLKYKIFHDDEGTLTSVTEKMINGNPIVEDELGYAKRSSAKEGMIPGGTAGGCVVNWNDMECNLGFGPGLDDKFKQDLWDNRYEYKGRLVKFSYQELSKEGVPRFGKLLGFRHDDDL